MDYSRQANAKPVVLTFTDGSEKEYSCGADIAREYGCSQCSVTKHVRGVKALPQALKRRGVVSARYKYSGKTQPLYRPMRVLVACEFSGIVRDAIISAGHEALSCDVLPTEAPGPHYQGDVRDVIHAGWDMMLAFPPCTHLAASGAAWFDEKRAQGLQWAAISFVRELWSAQIPRIAIENPVGVLSTLWRKPSFSIHPWQFGHGVTKETWIWAKHLPPLEPTEVVDGRSPDIYMASESDERWKIRSRTFQGIADAMASQWCHPIRVGGA